MCNNIYRSRKGDRKMKRMIYELIYTTKKGETKSKELPTHIGMSKEIKKLELNGNKLNQVKIL